VTFRVPGDRATTSWLSVLLVAAVYVAILARQVSGRGPEPWVAFLVGAFATVVLGVLPLPEADAVLASSLPVLVFLFALFVFAAELERAGAIDHIARWLIGRAEDPRDLPFVLFVGFGLVASVLVNDALVLLGVPLLLTVARRLELDPKPLLLTLAFSVTVGSVLTPMGNPQNLLVSLSSGIHAPVATFLRYLALPTAVNLILGGLFLRWRYSSKFVVPPDRYEALRRSAPPLFPDGGWGRRLRAAPALWLFPLTILVLATVDITSTVTGGPTVPIYAVALGGALVMLVLTPRRATAVARIDWTILLLFAGLFVVVGGAVSGGVTAGLDGLLPIPAAGHGVSALPSIWISSLGGPQLVSNVPWVALQIPVLQGLGYGPGTPVAWMALAGVATLAGNLTLLGAASNLILVRRAEREGVRISLVEFAREGIPLTLVTTAVLIGLLALGL
jgi:Na+/H+ antiporter NhaD/arsenite permease-like protein